MKRRGVYYSINSYARTFNGRRNEPWIVLTEPADGPSASALLVYLPLFDTEDRSDVVRVQVPCSDLRATSSLDSDLRARILQIAKGGN